MSFTFQCVRDLHAEWGIHRRLGQAFADWFTERRVLIVTDHHLYSTGIIAPALESLKEAGFDITVFDGVTADPSENVLTHAVRIARQRKVDIVLGLGGGSSMDVAKLVSVLVVSEQQLSELYGLDRIKGRRIPLVQMPTTAGTGSEVSNISILTRGESEKSGIVSHQLFADRVLLDAELTCDMPPPLTAATGIDAIVHAIEAYTSQNRKNPMSDMLAREALRLMMSNLITACRVGRDRDAREAMMLGASLAGQAFVNAPVAAVHALAYPLGGHFHIAHGQANALMLMPVLRFNMPVVSQLYAELGDAIEGPSSASAADQAEAFLTLVRQLLVDSGCPLRLREVGVPEASLPELAQDAMLQSRLLQNNPRAVTEEDALSLYREAF